MKLTKIETSPPIRIDTTVGTRVFAGDTMIFGDTGWRDMSQYLITGLAISSNFGRARMRRIGGRVEFDMKLDVLQQGMVGIFQGIPRGLWPISRYPMDNQAFTASKLGATVSELKSGTHTGVFYPNDNPIRTGVATPWPNQGTIAWTSSYTTDDPWPTSLPGLPA